MQRNELYAHCIQLTEEEAFYHRYYMAQKNADLLEDFLESLDAAYLSRKKFVVPELKNRLDLHFKDETWVWEDNTKDIYIHKHPRFMPCWSFEHDFYEMVYAYHGGFTVQIEGQSVTLAEGDVCLIPPHVHHTVHIFSDSIAFNTKIRKSTFHRSFSPMLSGDDMLANFFINTIYIGDYKDYILFHCRGNKQIKYLFSELYIEHYNQEKCYQKIINSLLDMIFSHLLRQCEIDYDTAKSGRTRIYKLERILGCIQASYKTVSLASLAKEFFFTEQYLSKYIKDNTGKTFKEIVRTIRLEKALELLETTSMNISSVSESAGYASPEHFMRQFKLQYGVSPSAYRKQKGSLI